MSFIKLRSKSISQRHILGNKNANSNNNTVISGNVATDASGLRAEAGETLTAGNLGYIDYTDGKIYEANINSVDNAYAMGFISNDAVSGDNVTLITQKGYIIIPTITLTGKYVYLCNGSVNYSSNSKSYKHDGNDIYQIVGINSNGNISVDIREPITYQ